MKILVLEPYYGGSHASFLQGLRLHLPFEFELLSLPARKWKWRMRMAAPYFADLLKTQGKQYDLILCSTFVDVATLRALAPAWVNTVPVITYFHENQFVYPMRIDEERDLHFALTNLTTALASDRLAFNSEYNRDTFLDGVAMLLKIASDMPLPDCEQRIRAKSTILHPGIDFGEIDRAGGDGSPRPCSQHGPVIVWNHRWEHDKNPEYFFETLFAVDKLGPDFSLIVLGQSFAEIPEIFQRAKQQLAHRILHFGYVASRQEYSRLLKCGDIIVSTANHEFYGMAVLEAVRAGCRPLLPNRLSYRELFSGEYLFEDTALPERLISLLENGQRLTELESRRLTDRFAWENLREKYRQWMAGVNLHLN
jgi:glycosyltransferase involved in cell wall biosynthesis